MRVRNQRVLGRNHKDNVDTELLSLYHNLPHNFTEADIVARLSEKGTPHTTQWLLQDLLQHPAHFEPPIANSGDITPPNSGDTDTRGQAAETVLHDTDGPAGSDLGFIPSRNASESVFIHGPPAPYGELPVGWRAAGEKTLSEVNNRDLGEYLIGIEAELKLPSEYWPKDKVSWYAQCMEHVASGDDPQVKLYKIAGEYQPADIFTKGLPRVAFERHRRILMGE